MPNIACDGKNKLHQLSNINKTNNSDHLPPLLSELQKGRGQRHLTLEIQIQVRYCHILILLVLIQWVIFFKFSMFSFPLI